uniref:Uncharacterized protein n=1 Tax=Cyanistes caeruleus TaxID=156563 RepID=A0A8C0Z7J2_CYACU
MDFMPLDSNCNFLSWERNVSLREERTKGLHTLKYDLTSHTTLLLIKLPEKLSSNSITSASLPMK